MSRMKGIGVLASGTVLAQVVTLAATPLLTRLYSPVSFATLALVVSTASMLAVFAHGRLTVAIATSGSEEEAQHLFATGKRLTWLVCGVAALLLLAAHAAGLARNHTVPIVLAGCLMGAVLALLDLHAFFRNAAKAYRISATANVVRAIATTLLQAAAALGGTLGLVFGAVGGALIGLAYSQWALFRSGRAASAPLSPISFGWLRETVQTHRNYIVFSAPQALVSALGHNLPPIILAATTDPVFVGHYWLAYRLLIAPISILGGSYRQASIPAFRNDAPRPLKTLVRDTAGLAFVVLLMGGALAWFGGEVFALAFGERWREAGDIAGVLVIGYGADLVKVPAICLLQARRRDKLLLSIETGIVLAKLAALAWALQALGPIPSLMIFTLTSAAGAAAFILTGAAIARSSHTA